MLFRVVGLLLELAGLALVALGVFVAFGPAQDDRTWNLMRDSASTESIAILEQNRTHFRLRELVTKPRAREQEDKVAWRQKAPPVLFLPGHQGKWTQVINVATYLNMRRPVAFFAVDFHASPAALHQSVIIQQGAYAAAAANRVLELYDEAERPETQLTVIGHSMGGVVAQQAMRILHQKGGRERIRALILMSTPVMGHPLAVEPSMGYFSQGVRKDFWGRPGVAPFTVMMAAGETDPLVPSEVVTPPEGSDALVLQTPSMHNVHSSFSHVNLLFSRHMLNATANLLSVLIDGNFAEAEVQFLSPLRALFKRPAALQTSFAPEVNGGNRDAPLLVASPPKIAGGAPAFAPVAWAELAQSLAKGPAAASAAPVPMEQLEADRLHVLPSPATDAGPAAAFTLLLLQRPKPIKRQRQDTTRGEDFDEGDVVQCDQLARVWAIDRPGQRQGPQEEEVESAGLIWRQVPAQALQYPTKMCVFHFEAGLAAAIKRLPQKAASLELAGWAQWHADPLPGGGGGAGSGSQAQALFEVPLTDWKEWAKAIMSPLQLRLPAGRATLCHLEVRLGHMLPFLPVDFKVVRGSMTPWGVKGVFVAADGGAIPSILVGAVRNVDEVPAAPKPEWAVVAGRYGWAAESAGPGVFAPRFAVPPSEVMNGTASAAPPRILILADPTTELVIEVRANPFSALARCFRTYLGYVLAAWFTAVLAIQMTSFKVLCVALWACVSIGLCLYWPDPSGATLVGGHSPGTPPVIFLVFIHILGSCLGFASYQIMDVLSWTVSILPGAGYFLTGSSVANSIVEAGSWALVHPSSCCVGVTLRSVLQLATVRRKTAGDANKNGSAVASAESAVSRHWLRGFAALMVPYLLCYLPSMVLTVWILLGHDREVSTPGFAAEHAVAYRTSRTKVKALLDSYIFESRKELRKRIALPVVSVTSVGHRTYRLFYAMQPALIGHAFASVMAQLAFAAQPLPENNGGGAAVADGANQQEAVREKQE